MAGLLGNMLLLGLATGLAPFGVVALLVVMSGASPARNGTAFLIGWITVLTVIVVVAALVLHGQTKQGSTPDTIVLVIEALLGAVLLVWGWRLWKRRHDKDTETIPPWMERLQHLGFWPSVVAGLAVPTYPTAIAAGVALARTELATSDRVAALVVFLIAASIAEAFLVGYAKLRPATTEHVITTTRTWILRNRPTIGAAAVVLIGLWILVQAVVNLIDS